MRPTKTKNLSMVGCIFCFFQELSAALSVRKTATILDAQWLGIPEIARSLKKDVALYALGGVLYQTMSKRSGDMRTRKKRLRRPYKK